VRIEIRDDDRLVRSMTSYGVCLGFRVEGLGFRVYALGFRLWN